MKDDASIQTLARFAMIVLLVGTIAVLLPNVAKACPNCQEALASNSQGGGDLVDGFFWSILFMMCMPFAILGTFSGYMYYEVRKARTAREMDETNPQPGKDAESR